MAESLQRLVAWFSAQGIDCYLVGGCVRDLILDRPSHDMDVIVAGDALAMGRRLADHFQGAFYILDPERGAARVLLAANPQGQPTQPPGRPDRAGTLPTFEVDFTRLAEGDIYRDLAARDFTINAMARPLHGDGLGALIDPNGGQDDLARRCLRAVSSAAFQSDPIRILRAVRLAHELGLEVHARTATLAAEAVPLLGSVSVERIRDELCRVLDLTPVGPPVRQLLQWGALWPVVGQQPNNPLPTQALDAWDALWADQAEMGQFDPEAVTILRQAVNHYRDNLAVRLSEVIADRRSRGTLLKWAALLLDDQDAVEHLEAVLTRFHFSNVEIRRIGMAAEALTRPGDWIRRGTVSPPELHRFYRRAGDLGPEALVLYLCLTLTGRPDALEAGEPGTPPAAAQTLARLVSSAWEAYFAQHESVVAPPRLLDGTTLMARFSLQQGPRIRELLDEVQEAQAGGDIRTLDEALRWVERKLSTTAQR